MNSYAEAVGAGFGEDNGMGSDNDLGLSTEFGGGKESGEAVKMGGRCSKCSKKGHQAAGRCTV